VEVSFSASFKKAFGKRIKGTLLEETFWKALDIFIADPFTMKLKTHKLSGKLRGLWSFSIEHDLRVIFYFTNDKPRKAVLVDIGSHDNVY